jgi:hypothetical protein
LTFLSAKIRKLIPRPSKCISDNNFVYFHVNFHLFYISVNFNDIPSCSRNLGFEEESPNVQRTMSLTMDMNLTNAADGQFNRTEETMFFSPGQTSTPLRMMRSISVDEMYSE